MKAITKYIIPLSIALIFFSSCTKRIDIKLNSDETRLVVEGVISNLPGNNYVKLTTTADYFSNTQPQVVKNALVSILSEADTILLVENDSIEGFYDFPENFIGTEGVEYDLNISLDSEIGGYDNFSAHTFMPYLTDDIDSVAVEWNSRFEAWLVRLYAQEPPTEDYYMFTGYRNGISITDSISKVNISDDKLFNGNYTNGIGVLFFDDFDLETGDIFTLGLSNITKEYASFVTEVQTEIQYNEPLFSGPPANVSSNISNNAIGWFTAYPTALTSTTVGEKVDPEGF